jgi:PKD repeat protein
MKHQLLLCGLLAATTALYLPAQSQVFTTTFGGTVGSSTFWASPSVSFDLDVTNPSGIVIDSVDMNIPYSGFTGQFEIYTTDVGGTHLGFQVAPPPGTWFLRGTAPITASGTGSPSPAILNKPFHLTPGTYGVYIVHRGVGVRYSSGGQLVYSNADMTLTAGSAQATAFTSTVNANRTPNLSIYYTVPTDIVDFTADITSGSLPLVVNFTDRSRISSGSIVGYEWDLDGDGNVDSTQQNPSFAYTTCGDYSPRLRILTTAGPFEYTWTDLIQADPLVADFSASATNVLPNTQVQFSDASIGAVAWTWDFDGDGVVDSTQQNPAWTFGAGSYNVTLTVFNGCRQESTSLRIDAVTDSWTTNYTAGNNLIAMAGIAFFDIQVNATEALLLSAIDSNTIIHTTQPCEVKIWITEGDTTGKTNDPSAWRQIASGAAISPGGNRPLRIVLDRPIVLLPGRSYGMAVHHLDCHQYYNSPGATQMWHPDFQVTFRGVSTATTPFSFAESTRQWNGGFHYTKIGSWPIGAITTYGFGCAGALGVPGMVPVGTSRPKLGTQWAIDITNMPLGSGVVIFGLSSTTSAFGPLPFDVSGLGMTGCRLQASLDITVPIASAGSTATLGLSLQNNPSLAGIELFLQTLVIDPSANPFAAVFSDSIAVATGAY